MRLQLLNRASDPGLPLWLALIALASICLSCRGFDDRAGASGAVEAPVVDVAGTWEGEWSTTLGVPESGTVTFTLEQDEDGNVFGTSVWTNSQCWSFEDPADVGVSTDQDSMPFSGTVVGSLIPAAAVINRLADPVGSSPQRVGMQATGRLEIIGDRMAGTYVVTTPITPPDPSVGRCADDLFRRNNRGVVDLRRTED